VVGDTPLNGFGRRYWVRQVSREEAERKNWEVSERPTDRYVTVDDPRTGLPVSMPAGTDPGWDNSHRRSQQLDRLRQVLAAKRRRESPMGRILLSYKFPRLSTAPAIQAFRYILRSTAHTLLRSGERR
jgi:hypothetical protein